MVASCRSSCGACSSRPRAAGVRGRARRGAAGSDASVARDVRTGVAGASLPSFAAACALTALAHAVVGRPILAGA